MANGTSTSHGRLSIAEILESPGRHEAYLAEVAAWAHDRMGSPAPELGQNMITITGNTDPTPTRRQVAGALLDEADWLAERMTAASAAERTWIAHVLVFTGLGQETAVLSEVRSELRPRLLRQGISTGVFHGAGPSTGVRSRNHAPGPAPWPCFALRVFVRRHD